MSQGFTGAGSAVGVTSINKTGDTPLTGAVTLTAGTNVTLVQSGNDITICSSGGGGGGSPGGSASSIQYNDGAGGFGGDNYFTYDSTSYSAEIGYDDGTNSISSTGCGNFLQHSTQMGSNYYFTGYANHINVIGYGGNITTCGYANQVSGSVCAGGYFSANGIGGETSGVADYYAGISSNCSGSKAFGYAASNCSSLIYSAGNGSMAHGWASGGGVLCSTGNGSVANGYADGYSSYISSTCDGSYAFGIANCTGYIQSASYGSMAYGYATNCGYIYSSNAGASAHGYADGSGSYLSASAVGSHLWGLATCAGYIVTCSYGGNWAGGYATNCGSVISSGTASGAFGTADAGSIQSSASGSLAHGYASNYAAIIAGNEGATASGKAVDSGSGIVSCGVGSTVTGSVLCGGYITTCAEASMVLGYSINSSSIIATCSGATGSFVHGGNLVGGSYGGPITAYGEGNLVGGVVNCGSISSNGSGSFVHGTAFGGYVLSAACGTAFAFGTADNGNTTANGNRAVVFGDNIAAVCDDSHAFGTGYSNAEQNSFQVGFGSSRFKVNADNAATQAGFSSGHIAKIGGKVDSAYTDVGNSGTSETDLYTYTTPAQALANDGEGLSSFYSVNVIGSATATSTFKVYFGGTSYFNSGALSLAANGNWQFWVEVIRTSSSTARISVTLQSPGAALTAYTNEADITGLDFTTTNILKLTGTRAGVGAATDDIVFKHGKVMWEAA